LLITHIESAAFFRRFSRFATLGVELRPDKLAFENPLLEESSNKNLPDAQVNEPGPLFPLQERTSFW